MQKSRLACTPRTENAFGSIVAMASESLAIALFDLLQDANELVACGSGDGGNESKASSVSARVVAGCAQLQLQRRGVLLTEFIKEAFLAKRWVAPWMFYTGTSSNSLLKLVKEGHGLAILLCCILQKCVVRSRVPFRLFDFFLSIFALFLVFN